MTPCVAVVVVGFRNAGDILRCLNALEASTYANFEVVICENGGPDAHRALVASAPEKLAGGQSVRIFLAPGNLGYGGGINLGIARSSGADAWWILNPDTEPEPGALAALIERLENGDCEAVGCTLYRPDGRVQSYGGRWRPTLARGESIGLGRTLESEVVPSSVEQAQTYLNGAAMLVGRAFLEAVGPMREDYFLYCEEVEWFIRARRRGMRLGFARGARIRHAQGTTTGAGGDIRQAPRLPVYLNERNRLLLTRDCFRAGLVVSAVGALCVLCLRYARRGAWRPLGFALAGWRAGLRGERGPPRWVAE